MNNSLVTQLAPARRVSVVSISPNDDDHVALRRILNRAESSAWTRSEWILHPRPTLESALPALRQTSVPIVFSEQQLGAGTWKDVLSEMSALPTPPLLIVSSRTADEYLWAEALNLGAHDVLAKPFDAQEVCRVAEAAWHSWNNKQVWWGSPSPCVDTRQASGDTSDTRKVGRSTTANVSF